MAIGFKRQKDIVELVSSVASVGVKYPELPAGVFNMFINKEPEEFTKIREKIPVTTFALTSNSITP